VTRRTSTPNIGRIQHLLQNPNFVLQRGDVTDATCVNRIVAEGYDEIYNLAAQSFVKDSFDEPGHTFDVDFRGCLNVLEAIRHYNSSIAPHFGPWPDKPRFYQASTSEMFGTSYSTEQSEFQHVTVSHHDIKVDGGDRSGFQDEGTPFRPTSPYAIAKLAAHNMVKLYRESYGIFACSGILFNHESPRRGEEFVTRKITRYLGKLLAEGLGKVGYLTLGNIEACRDWGHARDYVAGQVRMLRAEKADDYVLATGETHSVREFLDVAFSHVGLEWGNYVKTSDSHKRPSEVPYLLGRATKAKEVLGWEPKTSFVELVHEMVDADLVLGERDRMLESFNDVLSQKHSSV
jgi:GDPmannose 4,6-dehydratase